MSTSRTDKRLRVAVVQASSVPFDKEAGTEKTVRLLHEAAREGADLVVFPEVFIGGYPKGSTFGTAVGIRTDAGREEFRRYSAGAVTVDGPEVQRIAEAASEAGAAIVIGILERDGGTLYCTALLVSPEEGLVGAHRKLMPTGSERLVWGFGDGSTLDTMTVGGARVGSVICWENYMPLLRQAMYAKGVDIYCAPTVDDRPTWQATMTHVALEGRVFVLSACQFASRDSFPDDHVFDLAPPHGETVLRGGSVILDPAGAVLAGPLYDKEGILTAEIDLADRTRARLDFDPVGHYARPDVFTLGVNERRAESVTFSP